MVVMPSWMQLALHSQLHGLTFESVGVALLDYLKNYPEDRAMLAALAAYAARRLAPVP